MRIPSACTMSRCVSVATMGAWFAVGSPASVLANVITDWDDKAIAVVTPMASLGNTSPYMAQRMMAMVHAAMFDAVNSIERRYRPYLLQLPADPATSKEAAAAAAAAAVLATIDDRTAAQRERRSLYLSGLDPRWRRKMGWRQARRGRRCKDRGGARDRRLRCARRLSAEDHARRLCPDHDHDLFNVAEHEAVRHPQPVPVPTGPAGFTGEQGVGDRLQRAQGLWRTGQCAPNGRADRDRPVLASRAASGLPFVRQLVTAKQMSVVDSARFMALVSLGLTDSIIAVLDAKYYYNFWRPITAIRNGDVDGNPATDREATWQPIAITPMHPEYPCAHCIQSGSVAAVVKAVFATEEIPEIAITSPTAPGITHRWTSMTALTEEIASARIWAGFHYRFSTRVGTQMGYRIGEYVVRTAMQPVETASR
jgi:PAP2 superfamily